MEKLPNCSLDLQNFLDALCHIPVTTSTFYILRGHIQVFRPSNTRLSNRFSEKMSHLSKSKRTWHYKCIIDRHLQCMLLSFSGPWLQWFGCKILRKFYKAHYVCLRKKRILCSPFDGKKESTVTTHEHRDLEASTWHVPAVPTCWKKFFGTFYAITGDFDSFNSDLCFPVSGGFGGGFYSDGDGGRKGRKMMGGPSANRPPAAKKPRTCGICHMPGHTRVTCPQRWPLSVTEATP